MASAADEMARRLARLQRELGLSDKEIEALLLERSARSSVPVSLFANKRLTPLEAIIKHLHETQAMRLCDIATTIGRDPREISIAYQRARTKKPARLAPAKTALRFPLHLLKDRQLSPFEHVIEHLRTHHAFNLKQIATLTRRDERTIGTIARRARNKAAA